LVKFGSNPGVQRALLFGIGAFVGFGSGLTGTGGPVLSVPIMMICGFPPLTSIAASQVIQIAVGLSGTMCNLAHGAIDFGLVFLVTVLELAGVLVGVRLIHRVGARQVKRFVAVACIIVGAFLLCSSAISDLGPGSFYARFFR
jgi:uncharacterized membrane protein YfcA